jgi:hypothetical protein
MMTTWGAVHRAGRLATLACGLTACSAIRRTVELPSPEEGARRESVTLGASSCLLNRCRQDVKVGSERFQVETRVRAVPLRELPGAIRGSAVGNAAADVSLWSMRQFGITTVEHLLRTATRSVRGAGESGWRATCDIAWIDEWSRRRGEQADSLLRVADGMECRVAALPDTTVVRWRFRRGMSPTPDSIARVLDTLAWSVGAKQRQRHVLPMVLAGMGGDPRGAGGYTISEDVSAPDWKMRPALWRVARPDGVRIASLHWRVEGVTLAHALDFTAAVSADEASVLRLITAAVIAATVNP